MKAYFLVICYVGNIIGSNVFYYNKFQPLGSGEDIG